VIDHRRALTSALVLSLLACGGEDDDAGVVRGRGLQLAALPAATEAQVYDAALRAAFDVEPSLSLLLYPRRLPRTAGDAGGQPVPAEVVSALRRLGAVKGTCEPPDDASREAPRCPADLPGYVVRPSDVFRMAGDTVQLHLAAERYGTSGGGAQEALRFEKVYQLAQRQGAWRVVGEARAPEP
jgi:hypothetical protein